MYSVETPRFRLPHPPLHHPLEAHLPSRLLWCTTPIARSVITPRSARRRLFFSAPRAWRGLGIFVWPCGFSCTGVSARRHHHTLCFRDLPPGCACRAHPGHREGDEVHNSVIKRRWRGLQSKHTKYTKICKTRNLSEGRISFSTRVSNMLNLQIFKWYFIGTCTHWYYY